jgi:hypothetical protein
MTLQSSGTISMSNLNTEMGYSATAQVSLNDPVMRTLAGVPSGAISLSDFYGKTSGFTYNVTISANTTNYNMKAAAITAGWNQTVKLTMSVTINAGVYVYSTSTGTYAFDTGSTFPTGTTLSLVNNGVILGNGGTGGNGRSTGITGIDRPAGTSGGPAFIARQVISVTNNGTIGGGGGGGDGGLST